MQKPYEAAGQTGEIEQAMKCFAENRWGEAAQKLAELLNDDTFRSLEGKSKHQVGNFADLSLVPFVSCLTDVARAVRHHHQAPQGRPGNESGGDPEGRHPQVHR
eukprot:1160158-Pelagomonas_calceolata.AAC.3